MVELPTIKISAPDDGFAMQPYPEAPTLNGNVSLAPRLPTKLSMQEALAFDFEVYEVFPKMQISF